MRVVDAAQRAAALDASRSFLVRAPAGSGKTELLIQRYLALVARASRPEAVVAITFTRKAAAEMRRRVADALARARGERPEKAHEAATWDLARAALARDERLGWRLEENPRRLAIRTFDSLCTAIVRRAPWLSRLGPPPAPAEDASELLDEAARRTVELLESEPYGDALETLLLHVDNDAPKLAGLLASMLARRDQWLRHVVGRDPAELRAEGEAALCTLVGESLERMRGLAPAEFVRQAPVLARSAAANLIADGKEGHPLAACRELETLPPADASAVEQWKGLAALVLTGSGSLRSPRGINKTLGFPTDSPEKPRLQKLLAALEGADSFLAALGSAPGLPPTAFDDEQWRVAEALVRVLPLAAAQLRLLFHERATVDFPALSEGARLALGGAGEPTDLALSLDAAVEHLLVDEFQDTSYSQLRLLEGLTAGWTPGDGRTLFLVGDPMQSIYRFREAEVRNFLDAERERRLGDVELESLVLEANFRSRANVVEWVNEAFPKIFPEDPDPARGGVPFAHSACAVAAEPGPAVGVHPFFEADGDKQSPREAEARTVAGIVARARAERPEETVAILVRARTHLPAILRELQAAGIGYRAVDLDPLSGSPAVQDLLSLTAALLHPADRLSWLAVLRAPWCGLTLAELHALRGDWRRETVWQALADPERWARMAPESRRRIERLRAAVEAPRPRTLRAWVEGVWFAIGGPATARGAAELDSAEAFLDLLDELDEGRDADLDALSDRATKLFAAPDPAASGVEVMTVHKAKGLQFDTVIVPGLGRQPKRSDPQLLRWMEVVRGGEPALLLAPSRSAAVAADPIHDALRRFEMEQERNEAARLLYVATTRAKRELHLLGAAKLKRNEKSGEAAAAPMAGSLLELLWPAVEAVYEQARPDPHALAATAEMAHSAEPRLFRRLAPGWVSPELPAPAVPAAEAVPLSGEVLEISFRWAGELARHVGTVVHAALAEIGREGPAAWNAERLARARPRWQTALRALGVGPEDMPRCAAEAEEAIRRTLADERGRWALDPAHADVYSELALAGAFGGRIVERRVDRAFVDAAGVRWIVDFKTSRHEGGGREAFLDNEAERYRRQMEQYRELFVAMEPERPVRMGLYFPLMGAWREYDAERAAGAAG